MAKSDIHLIINSTQEPKKIIFKGIDVDQRFDSSREIYDLYVFLEKWYPHPEAPEDAVIPILEKKYIASFERFNNPVVDMFYLNKKSIQPLLYEIQELKGLI